MKKIIPFLILLVLAQSCSNPSDCVESSGSPTTKNVAVSPFTRIYVSPGIELVVKQGPVLDVTIKSGENLIDDVEVTQSGNTLTLKTKSQCNWVRDYGQTIIYVTTPVLDEIYSKTERNISSDGVLAFPVLRLYAFDKQADGIAGAGTGDFFIAVNNSQLVVQNNNVSRFFISGSTTEAVINFYAGDGRIDAANLIAQNITVYHRSSNDMILKPIQSIKGKMVSTGNIILKNNPPLIDVEQLYQGQLFLN